MTLLILIAIASTVEPFPIAGSKTSRRREQHRHFTSSNDRMAENTQSIGTDKISKNDGVEEDTEALSGLLGEMFQAKLEMSRESKELESLTSQNTDMPVLGNDGIYRIISQSQLENFKAAHSDKLVFLKFSSPICAACRMLKQKFQTLHRSPKFAGAPVVFADIVISNNKKVHDPFRDYITSQLRVQRVPSIHFYAGGNDAHVDQIFCDDQGGGCSWPKIQQQMLDFIGRHYTAPPTPKAAHNASMGVGGAAAAAIDSTKTSATTTSAVAHKISKRQWIRKLLSLSWLRIGR